MHRSRSPRAAWPLIAALLALATSVALGADATWTTAADRQPTATTPTQAQVAGLTVGATADGADGAVAAAAIFRATSPEDAFGWRSGWFPPLADIVAPVATKTVAPAATVAHTTAATAPTAVWWHKYQGTNHVWMPTLGITRHVYFYPCSRTTDLANVVYRWSCPGHNNVYLLGHNFGVFHPLYNAYYNGKLRKGMPVVYANGSGRTRLYRVVTWRVVSPTESAWAMASQSRPSMTLQTCIGPNGSLRLVVRLVAVDR